MNWPSEKNNGHSPVSLSDFSDLQPHAEKVLWTISMGFFKFNLHDEVYKVGFYSLNSFIFL